MMKKLMMLLVLSVLMLNSCSDTKDFTINGKSITVEPYGLANEESKKDDRIVYSASCGDVICSIIFIETIIVPVWLLGWNVMEPVRVKVEYLNPPTLNLDSLKNTPEYVIKGVVLDQAETNYQKIK